MNMKKKNRNIIPFPNLRERLLEKGLDALQAKQYEKALRFFDEANELKPNDPEVELSIVVCLFELGEWEEAKRRCQRLLYEQKGDDVQLLQIYLSILIQLQQYAEVEATIQEALQKRPLSPTVREHFVQLLQFSQRMSQRLHPFLDDKEIRRLLESDHVADQLKAIKHLENDTIVPFLPIVKQYLINESNHPMAKTMMLRLLTVKNINEAVTVSKFGKTMTVIPAQLDESAETGFAINVLKQLEHTLANDSPSLYETASHIWLRYVYMLYPFLPIPTCSEIWEAALYVVACQLQGIEGRNDEIIERYGVKREEVDFCCKKLYEIEEISFV